MQEESRTRMRQHLMSMHTHTYTHTHTHTHTVIRLLWVFDRWFFFYTRLGTMSCNVPREIQNKPLGLLVPTPTLLLLLGAEVILPTPALLLLGLNSVNRVISRSLHKSNLKIAPESLD